MKKGFLFLMPLLFCVAAQADLLKTFKKINSTFKGPFGSNVLQGTEGRATIRDGGTPRGKTLFQSAYRNEMAHELAVQDNFYLANLFTTNYYELMGEYVYGNFDSSHSLDHARLLARQDQAMPKAASMVRHWILEKYYAVKFPESQVSKGFKLRGISSAENELEFATYFFNFYLSSMQNDFEFLPAFLLLKGSPIGQVDSLEEARNLVAADYDNLSALYGAGDAMVRRVYQIRNAVHNQMSESIVAEIDRFFGEYPGYRRDGYRGLVRTQEIVRSYFRITAKRVSEVALKAGMTSVKAWADKLNKEGSSVENLYGLSAEIAAVRIKLTDRVSIPTQNKTQVLLVIATAAQFMNKEIIAMRTITSPRVIETIVNVVFAEGFFIQDNWQYFTSEIKAAPDLATAAAIIPDLISIASDTLDQSLAPAFAQWLLVEPKMQMFLDNTIKGSALSVASITLGKIRK